jgi:hypothetical protein
LAATPLATPPARWRRRSGTACTGAAPWPASSPAAPTVPACVAAGRSCAAAARAVVDT